MTDLGQFYKNVSSLLRKFKVNHYYGFISFMEYILRGQWKFNIYQNTGLSDSENFT